ncbi:MAG: vitamin K epoxide reductase family protein [Candidatus Spechtbacterales bacterium]|nr:vitamin K epoxide reductase family protein [Candidatus Spechtbacterales bacterium]
MKDLKHLLKKNLASHPSKALIAVFLILSFASLLVSAYLAAEHYTGSVPPCSLVSGCEVVTTSEYSVVMGIPVAIFGVPYFLALIIFFVAYLDSKKELYLKLALLWTIPGAGIALTLLAIQAFILNAFCIYCLTADISSLIIFLGMVKIFWYTKDN